MQRFFHIGKNFLAALSITFLLFVDAAFSQVLQFKGQHSGENCDGGVVLFGDKVVGNYLVADNRILPKSHPVIELELSSLQTVDFLITGESQFLEVLSTRPPTELTGKRLLLLKEGAAEVGYIPLHTTRRDELKEYIVIGSYVNFHECAIDSYLDRQTAEKRYNSVKWSNTQELFFSATGKNGANRFSVWAAFSPAEEHKSYADKKRVFQSSDRDRIFDLSRMDEVIDFQDDNDFERCYSPIDRVADKGKKFSVDGVEQCATWSLTGVPDISGKYVEFLRDIEHIYLLSSDPVGDIFGIPVSRMIRAQSDYLLDVLTLDHRVKDTDSWLPIGVFESSRVEK